MEEERVGSLVKKPDYSMFLEVKTVIGVLNLGPGWVLLGYEKVLKDVGTRSLSVPGGVNRDGNFIMHGSVEVSIMSEELVFIVGRVRDEAVADLMASAERLRGELREAEKEFKKLEISAASVEKENKTIRGLNERLLVEKQKAEKRIEEAEIRSSKLRRDLELIRDAIGELKLKEIVKDCDEKYSALGDRG